MPHASQNPVLKVIKHLFNRCSATLTMHYVFALTRPTMKSYKHLKLSIDLPSHMTWAWHQPAEYIFKLSGGDAKREQKKGMQMMMVLSRRRLEEKRKPNWKSPREVCRVG